MKNDLKKELKSDHEASHTDLKQDFDKTRAAVDSLTFKMDGVSSKVSQMDDRLTRLEKRVNDNIASVTTKICDIETTVNAVQADHRYDVFPHHTAYIESCVKEISQRTARKINLILFNIPESHADKNTSPKEKDLATVIYILQSWTTTILEFK